MQYVVMWTFDSDRHIDIATVANRLKLNGTTTTQLTITVKENDQQNAAVHLRPNRQPYVVGSLSHAIMDYFTKFPTREINTDELAQHLNLKRLAVGTRLALLVKRKKLTRVKHGLYRLRS